MIPHDHDPNDFDDRLLDARAYAERLEEIWTSAWEPHWEEDADPSRGALAG